MAYPGPSTAALGRTTSRNGGCVTEAQVPKVLLINNDKATLGLLETMFRPPFHVHKARDVAAGSEMMPKTKPDLVVVGHQARRDEAVRFLTWMRQNGYKPPVVVVLGPGTDLVNPKLLKLGVRGFVEHPPDKKRVQDAIDAAVKFRKAQDAPPPPVTLQEARSNLSELEKRLNGSMKCFAGLNKVFIQSQIGGISRPRICLKCPLRPEYGLPANVFYEFIENVCCGDPNKCEAYSAFQQTREWV
jgi:AmiR/NasT family two-component response regulator